MKSKGLAVCLAGLLLVLWCAAALAVQSTATLGDQDCERCHGATVELFGGQHNAHADNLACDDCHQQHTETLPCLECHEGHADNPAAASCAGCHRPHDVLPVRYGFKIDTGLCSDCHDDAAQTLAAGDSRHRRVGCFRCHPSHPPRPKSEPPQCSRCHRPQQQRHFTLAACDGCHTAHAPRIEDWESLADPQQACRSCHPQPEQTQAASPTAHSEFGCLECHPSHRAGTGCLDCHDPHDEAMTNGNCRECHPPHAPAPVAVSPAVAAPLCGACHQEPATELTAEGGAHLEVGCGGCHPTHGPLDETPAADCDQCHPPEEQRHFSIEGCRSCHAPHSPLAKDLDSMEDLERACLSCHQAPGTQMAEAPSAHSELGCLECHPTHGEKLNCLECHDSHGVTMREGDCRLCHRPHQPTVVAWDESVRATGCNACHRDAVAEFRREGAGHRASLQCIDCHREHPGAGCTSCHLDHPEQGAKTGGACSSCHRPDKARHFAVSGCIQCHPPHRPIAQGAMEGIDLVAPACLSCHDPQAIGYSPESAHARRDCRECHAEHGLKPACQDCHAPHAEEMVQQDCLLCHMAHGPEAVSYSREVPAELCEACHQEPAQQLRTAGGGHLEAGCAACHPRHGKGDPPKCSQCHPRLQRRHFTLPDCASCHAVHAPQKLNMAALPEVKAACNTCHPLAARAAERHPSAHASLDCRKCHQKHGESAGCLGCHKGHDPQMEEKSCRRCHNHHAPTAISYRRDLPTAYCAACHKAQARKLASSGGGHRQAGRCVGCHPEHPPFGETTKAACSRCHKPRKAPHYALEACQGCHIAHAPLPAEFSAIETSKTACLSCHPQVEQEIAASTGHAALECHRCHTSHDAQESCLACHGPHAAGMKEGDCRNCHRSHVPTEIRFGAKTTAGHCLACHGDEAEAMAQNESKHRRLSCLDCHQGRHGQSRDCSNCHDRPHEPVFHQKWPDCGHCHGSPHTLIL